MLTISPSLFFLFLPFSLLQLLGRVLQRRELSSRGGRKAGEVGRRVTRNGKQITCLPGGSQRSSSGGGHGSSEGHGPGEGDRDAAGWHRGAPRGLPRRCALLAAGRRAAWGRRAGPAPHRTRCCCRHGAEASVDPRRPPAPGPLSTSGQFYALAAAPRSSPRSASTRVTRRSSLPAVWPKWRGEGRVPDIPAPSGGRPPPAEGEKRCLSSTARPVRAPGAPFPLRPSVPLMTAIGTAPAARQRRGAPRVRGMPRPHGTRTGRPRGISPLLVAGICADVVAILLST